MVFYLLVGFDFVRLVFQGGYEALTSPLAILFTDLLIIIFIPALYLASKVVKDRPFSSYSSSRGGWNFKLYFKALVIPVILYIIYMGAYTAITGPEGTYNFSIAFLAVILISVPLQSIAEEYIFRGLIMQTLGSWFRIPVLVIVLQAIIFALGHGYNSIGVFETLISGLGFGFFAWKTNGIEVSSALHTANNFSVGLFVMLGLQASTSSPQLGEVAVTIVFLIMLFIIMYYVGKKTDWFGEIPENSQNVGLFNYE
ncbi:CPBP family intramembrane glutamic endopeptidase [Methanobrevibacter sp.]|uniref:CPBP family intramembrane glutamic endopeptidase n=1 Tax=Methanobrevibacter sp. TaxID=66852 RepID=UPI00386DB39A